MMRIAIAGASGRMGRMLIESVSQSTDLTLAAALDVASSPMIGQDACAFLGKPSGVLITENLSALKGADCLIDFTRPEGTLAHLAVCRVAAFGSLRAVRGQHGDWHDRV